MQRSVRSAELKAECVTLERGVLRSGFATEADLKRWKPGGEDNSGRDARAWLTYYARLHRWHSKGERSDGENGFDPHDMNDRRVLDALRNEPVPVRLIDAIVIEGEPVRDTVHVYAKSLDALLHVHALDRTLAMLMMKKLQLEQVLGPASELLTRTIEVISYSYQLLVWIVTSPGPEMPWEADNVDPIPPMWITKLQAWDVIRICQATQEHQLRLAALSALVDVKSQNETGGTRPSWSMFVANMAMEMKEPGGANTLMKHRALVELLASVQLFSASRNQPSKDSDSDGTGLRR